MVIPDNFPIQCVRYAMDNVTWRSFVRQINIILLVNSLRTWGEPKWDSIITTQDKQNSLLRQNSKFTYIIKPVWFDIEDWQYIFDRTGPYNHTEELHITDWDARIDLEKEKEREKNRE